MKGCYKIHDNSVMKFSMNKSYQRNYHHYTKYTDIMKYRITQHVIEIMTLSKGPAQIMNIRMKGILEDLI